jgi:DNA-binding MarR family transcriptional regulator
VESAEALTLLCGRLRSATTQTIGQEACVTDAVWEQSESGDDPYESVERQLALLLRRARRMSVSIAAEVHPGLDATAYGMLVLLDTHGPVRAADIVGILGLDKSTVSRQLSALSDLGLAERLPDPTDRRASLVQVTAVGHERLTRAREDRLVHLRTFLHSWPEDDVSELARLLGRLNESAV